MTKDDPDIDPLRPSPTCSQLQNYYCSNIIDDYQ